MKRLAADTQVIFRRLKPAAALLFLMLCVPESLFAGSPPITCTIATNDYSGGVEEISTYEPIAKIKMVSGAGAVAANLTAIKIENIGAVLPSNISKVAVWIRQADPVSWTGGTVETFFGAASAWVGSTITVSGTFSVTASLTWNIYITYNLASGLTPGTSVALRLNPAALTYGAVDSTVYPLTSSTRPVVSASIMSLPYTVDFESDPVWTAFSTAAVSTNWERGPPTGVGPSSAYGGTNAYGTDLDANYGVFAKTHLTTRIINLSANSTLNFHHWNRDELAYDGGCVLISTDTAWGWTQLTPVGGYPSAAVAGLDIPDVGDNRPGYSSTVVADWRAAEFDLSAYTGKKVRLRFYFASDTSIVNPGWYIDDFYIAKTGVDLTLNQSDIDLKPPSAEFNEVVAVSATIRNIGTSNGEKIDIKQETAGGSNTYIDNLRPQGQGFVIGTPMSITAVGLNALDYGAVGDVTTIKITTGTTSLPYIGSMGAKVLAEKAITISNTSLAWVKAVFDEPVFLPVLPSGDAYWMVAYNPSAATDGAGWNRSDSDLYAPAARASSADGGNTWTNPDVYDYMFRVYLSSNIEVTYYNGDPDAGGTYIGISTIAAININQTRVSTMSWSGSSVEAYHNIYVHIDRANKIIESDDNNNKNFNTVLVSSAPDAVKDLIASASTTISINLNWQATGDDGFTGNLNNSTFTIQYTSATAWAQGNSWSTNTVTLPGYVYTVEIATTGVTAGSQRFYRQASLLANTTYFFRLWTKDDVARYSPLSNGATASTLANPVTGSQVYDVSYTSVTVNWQPLPVSPSSSTCEGYRLQVSTSSNFTEIIYSSVTLSVNVSTLTIKDLGTNTTYYFRVGSLNWIGEPNYTVAGSTCTLKPPPGSSPLNPEISAVFLSSMTMKWTSVSSDDGYLVQASTALDFTGTVSSSKTADGILETLTVSAPSLDSNTTYYLRVGSLWGETTAYAATQVASTLANPLASAQFEGVFITSAAVSWPPLPDSPQTATCEGYRLSASTASNFTGTIFSSSTPNLQLTTLTVSGLSPNTTYYFRAGSLNWQSVGNYLVLTATPTLASAPGQALPTALSVSSYSITAQWTAGSPANPSGTNYTLEMSSNNFDGLTPVFSSATKNLQAEVSGLMANTTYYIRPKAVNWAGISSGYGTTASTSTLAQLVSGAQFFQVNVTSVTANWLQLPASPSSSTCTGYILQASTASNFSGEIFSSATISGVVPSTLTVKNLYSDTWYYFRVGSYNWNFIPNYVSLGSQKTNIAVPPPDLMIMNSDIKFSPAAADFGWNVNIYADIRNLSFNFMETVTQQTQVGGWLRAMWNGRYLAQGFVVTKDMSLMSVEIEVNDIGTLGETSTVKITTGTTSIPSVGAAVLASKSGTAPTAYTYVKFIFPEPVRLPVLPSGDAYWIIAINKAGAVADGWNQICDDANTYAPAAAATSVNQGGAWTTNTDDCNFRIYQSTNVEASFYNGDPDAGGTFIGVSTIAAINTNKTRTSTMTWTAPPPEEYKNVYVYIDRADKIGESDETNNKAFNTIAISSAPDSVKDFVASTNSITAIDLKWYATGDDGFTGNLNNSTFTIQYTANAAWAQGNSWDPNAAPSDGNTVYIATTGVTAGSQRFYTQTGLMVNATYYFRLWTLDDFGRYSPLSNGATVCTLAAVPGLPAEPFAGVYFSSVSVLWLANGNPDYTEYRLQASTASNFTGTLYGPYVGPTGWLIDTSTAAVSLNACTTYYFQVQARNLGLIETAFQSLGSTRTVTYFDGGLRMFDGTQIVKIACQPTYCDTVSPLRIHKDGTNYAVGLVDGADPKASKLKIQTPSGIKYWRKY